MKKRMVNKSGIFTSFFTHATLNGFFSIIDLVTDKVSILSDTVVSAVSTAICKIFKRKGKEIDTDGEEE